MTLTILRQRWSVRGREQLQCECSVFISQH